MSLIRSQSMSVGLDGIRPEKGELWTEVVSIDKRNEISKLQLPKVDASTFESQVSECSIRV